MPVLSHQRSETFRQQIRLLAKISWPDNGVPHTSGRTSPEGA
jgi:hypothetical protein